MLRATRILAAGYVKKSTGLVGVPVMPDARERLISLYNRILTDVKVLPEGEAYRVETEELFKNRLELVSKTDDIYYIEQAVGGMQIEQMVYQAEGTIALIPQYAEWKWWERPLVPNVDKFDGLYKELERLNPGSISNTNLRHYAEKLERDVAKAKVEAAKRLAPPTTSPEAPPKQ